MRARIIYATLVAGALAVLVYALPAVAHHAFGAEFDPDAPIRLQGNIVRVEWVNPHSWIHLEITQDDGTKEVWMVEGGTPNVLQRRGLRRECLPIGTELIVDGATQNQIREAAVASGMVPLETAAMEKVKDSETTISEVVRTVYAG